MEPVLVALRAQLDELDALLAPLDEAGWALPSACEGWTIADVVLHLAQTNELATASALGDLPTVAQGWDRAEGATVDDAAGAAVARARGGSGAEVATRWRRSAEEMVAALAACPPGRRVTWVAGDMAARTLATTRLAETWIHSGDAAEGLGIDLPATERLWHIARLAHRTLPYALTRAADTTSPREPATARARAGVTPTPGMGTDAGMSVRFVLGAPGGDEEWTFGPDDAPTVVKGPALDLCRVAGQRAAAADTDLIATGPDAERVLALVRTFA